MLVGAVSLCLCSLYFGGWLSGRVNRLRLDLEEWVGVLHGCGLWGICLGGSRSVDWDSESELLASPCIIHDHVFGVFGGWKRRT